MITLVSKEGMKNAEAAAVARGVSYLTLMENAGTAVAKYILKTVSPEGKTAVVLCGQGNNGGDGFVISRLLSAAGIKTLAVTLGAPATASATEMQKGIGSAKIITPKEGIAAIEKADIIVDALFGTGLSRKIEGAAADLITAANKSKAERIAVDIPSGAECDTGKVFEPCFRADVTLTFEGFKPCHILPPANALCGRVEALPIGIEEKIMENFKTGEIIEPFKLKKRDKNSHKGSFGTLLLLGGSYGMPGAAVMSGLAALRSGVGILKAAVIPQNYEIMATAVPEAVLVPCQGTKGRFAFCDLAALVNAAKNVTAFLVGPGLGVSASCRYLTREICLFSEVPVIVDADGINCIADDIEFIKRMKAPLVLTPHPGEMSRLTGLTAREIEADRIGIARAFAEEHRVWLVLKGANTVVASPEGEIFVNVSGNPGLATGGSGDVLSGIMAAFLAMGIPLKDAVCGAVQLHGRAADELAEKMGEASLLPRDMIDALPHLLK